MEPKTVTVGTPILFLQEFKDIPNALLRIFGLPSVSYDDSEPYSINKVVTYFLGVNVFQLIGILGLSFLASLVMVSLILPNLYFRVMLHTDATTPNEDPSRINDLLLLKQKLEEAETRLKLMTDNKRQFIIGTNDTWLEHMGLESKPTHLWYFIIPLFSIKMLCSIKKKKT